MVLGPLVGGLDPEILPPPIHTSTYYFSVASYSCWNHSEEKAVFTAMVKLQGKYQNTLVSYQLQEAFRHEQHTQGLVFVSILSSTSWLHPLGYL